MKLIKQILTVCLIAAIIFGCVSCASSCYSHVTYTNTIEYQLTELEDGVYGYYNAIVSNIPAENYEMITLCLSGKLFTLDGTVNIHYVDNEHRLVWHDTNLVHGDTFDVYVPTGSIVMRPNLVQS